MDGIRTDRPRGIEQTFGRGDLAPQLTAKRKSPIKQSNYKPYKPLYHIDVVNRYTWYITDYTITVSEIYKYIIYIHHR